MKYEINIKRTKNSIGQLFYDLNNNCPNIKLMLEINTKKLFTEKVQTTDTMFVICTKTVERRHNYGDRHCSNRI